jgi:hypothetical protein
VLGTRESGSAPSGSQAKSSGAVNQQLAARQSQARRCRVEQAAGQVASRGDARAGQRARTGGAKKRGPRRILAVNGFRNQRLRLRQFFLVAKKRRLSDREGLAKERAEPGVFLAEASGYYGLDKIKMQRLSLGSSWSSSRPWRLSSPMPPLPFSSRRKSWALDRPSGRAAAARALCACCAAGCAKDGTGSPVCGRSWSSSAQTQHAQPAVCGQSSYVTAVHRFPVSTRPKTARRSIFSSCIQPLTV